MGKVLLTEQYNDELYNDVEKIESKFEQYASYKFRVINQHVIDYAKTMYDNTLQKAQFSGIFAPTDFDFDMTTLKPVIEVTTRYQRTDIARRLRQKNISLNEVSAAYGINFGLESKDVKYVNLLRGRQDKLAEVLEASTLSRVNRIVEKGVRNGDSFADIGKQLSTSLGFDGVRARKIARTETNWALNEGARQYMSDLGIREYGISPARNACEICKEVAAKTNSNGKRGTPTRYSISLPSILPIHPNCRCTIYSFIPKEWLEAPVIEDLKMESMADLINERKAATIISGNKVLASANPYNRAYEEISRTLTGDDQKRALQNLANTLPVNDPLAQPIRSTLRSIYGIEPTAVASQLQSVVDTKLATLDRGQFLRNVALTNNEKQFLVDRNIVIKTQQSAGDGVKAEFTTPQQGKTVDPMITVYNAAKDIKDLEYNFYHELGHAIDYLKVQPRTLSDTYANNIRYTPISEEFKFIDAYYGTEKNEVLASKISRFYNVSRDDAKRLLAGQTVQNMQIGTEYNFYIAQKTEVFAEAYAQFRTNPEAMKKYAPSLYQLMETLWTN